ncbi:MAG: DUF4827 family protein [Muribaculaceae bacterium]
MKSSLMRHTIYAPLLALALVGIAATSCSDSKTYAELLTDENHYVNAYLADHHVINEIPADTVFETGLDHPDNPEDAPFYRMDSDGQIYMQVLDPGSVDDPDMRAQTNELFYFRYVRYNLKYYYGLNPDTGEPVFGQSSGNVQDMSIEGFSFRYGNYTLSSSTQWGTGIQLPLMYLPVDCVVNIIIKSQYGFTDETADVMPYMFNIRYYRPKI